MEEPTDKAILRTLVAIRVLLTNIDARGVERERLTDERWAQLDREAAEERARDAAGGSTP